MYTKAISLLALLLVMGCGSIEFVSERPDVPDTIPPVITILGPNPFRVPLGAEYKDPGVKALDNWDKKVYVRTLKDRVDTNKVGSYFVVYSTRDSSGNLTFTARTVLVR